MMNVRNNSEEPILYSVSPKIRSSFKVFLTFPPKISFKSLMSYYLRLNKHNVITLMCIPKLIQALNAYKRNAKITKSQSRAALHTTTLKFPLPTVPRSTHIPPKSHYPLGHWLRVYTWPARSFAAAYNARPSASIKRPRKNASSFGSPSCIPIFGMHAGLVAGGGVEQNASGHLRVSFRRARGVLRWCARAKFQHHETGRSARRKFFLIVRSQSYIYIRSFRFLLFG